MWVTTLAFFWSLIVQVGDGTKWREFNTQWRFTAKFQHYFKWFSATSFLSSKTCFSLFLLYLLPVSNVDAKLVTKLEEGIAGGICLFFLCFWPFSRYAWRRLVLYTEKSSEVPLLRKVKYRFPFTSPAACGFVTAKTEWLFILGGCLRCCHSNILLAWSEHAPKERKI